MLRRKGNDCLAVLLLIAVALVFFNNLLLHPTLILYPAPDLIQQFALWRLFLVHSVAQFHTIPLWNPYEFSGMPFLANPGTAIFYPPTLLYLLIRSDFAFGFNVILDVTLLGIFTYLYARFISGDKFGSLLSAVGIMLSGPVISRISAGHIYLLDVMIWLPLVLLCIELQIKKQKFIFTILTGIAVAMMILAGHSQMTFFSLFVIFLYFLFRNIVYYQSSHSVSRFFLISLNFFLALVIGIALSAIQLLPTLELSSYTLRQAGTDYEFSSSFSIPIPQLVSFVFPHAFGSPLINDWWGRGNFGEFTGYFGILLLLLAPLSFVYRNKYTLIFWILAFLTILIAIGKYGFFYQFIYTYVPGFNRFRVPARFLYIFAFSVTILGGFGASNLRKILYEEKKENKRKYIFFYLAILYVVSTVTLLAIYLSKDFIVHSFQTSYKFPIKNYTSVYISLLTDSLAVWSVLSFFILIILASMKKKIKQSLFMVLVFVLLFVELIHFGLPFIKSKDSNQVYANSFAKKVASLAQGYRVFDMSNLYIKDFQKNNIEITTGFNSFYLNEYREYFWLVGPHLPYPYESFIIINDINNINILRTLNVKIVVSKKQLFHKDLREIQRNGIYIYEIEDTLPRAYIVPKASVIRNKKTILQSISNPQWNPKETFFLEEDPHVNMYNPGSFVPISKVKKSNNEISMDVNLQQSGFLVLSEIWYPGWKVAVNGKETKLYRANYIFRSIYLKAGQNHVTFSYQPRSYQLGKQITAISLVFCAGYFFFYLLKNSIKAIKIVHQYES